MGSVADGLALGAGYNKVPEAKSVQYLRCAVHSSGMTRTVTSGVCCGGGV